MVSQCMASSRAWLALITVLFAAPVAAVEIAGVDVPPTFSPAPGHELVLNGAGIRNKLFVDVYVGALYLPRRTNDPQRAITMPGAKSVHMHILYDEISAERLERNWRKRLRRNHSEEEWHELRVRIKRYVDGLTTVRRGDVARLTFLPGKGTQVSVNGEVIDSIPGEDFYQALLRAWLGQHPADEELKAAMLGDGEPSDG